MIKNNFRIILMLIAFLLLVTACNREEATVSLVDDHFIQFEPLDRMGLDEENIVAIFEGGEITGAEFAEFLAANAFINPYAQINDSEYRLEMLHDLIMEKLIVDQFEEDDWVREQVDFVFDEITLSYGDDIAASAYKTLKISEDEVKKALLSIFKIEGYFQEQVTQLEMENFYHEVTDELTTATFTHILIANEIITENDETVERSHEDTLKIAAEIYTKILAGEDFNQLATEYSDDVVSIDSGGHYEAIFIEDLVSEFKEAILTQEIEEIGDLVQTEYGFHIIRVEDLQVVPFEEVEEAILGELTIEKFNEYYFEKLPSYIVEINL